MKSDRPSDELRLLLDALRDERLTETQWERLQEILRDDQAARREYVAQMGAIASLIWRWRDQPKDVDESATPTLPDGLRSPDNTPPLVFDGDLPPLGGQSPLAPDGPSSSLMNFIADCFRAPNAWIGRTLVVALLLVVGGGVAALLFIGNTPNAHPPVAGGSVQESTPAPQESESLPETPIFIARITDLHHARWQQGEELLLGSPIAIGQTLKLAAGLAEITFDNGARVLLEGPAEFVLDSRGQASLIFGQLTANVPEQAIGFTIQTPMVNVVDLGTEFGVRVSQKGLTDVAVFSGQVVATPLDAGLDSSRSIRVLADEVRRFWAGPAVEQEPLPAPEFMLSIPRPVAIKNADFESPRLNSWMARQLDGWAIVSQPPWEGRPNGGLLLATSERVQLPKPPSGNQWGFIETRRATDGGVHHTSIHQAVGVLKPDTIYRLQVTLGREAFTTHGYTFPFGSQGQEDIEIGLWSGIDRDSGPLQPLKILHNPVPKLAPGQSETVTLVYRSPDVLPPGEQTVFVRLAINADDWYRVLFDDVKLEAVPSQRNH
jgi:hypothetical protein